MSVSQSEWIVMDWIPIDDAASNPHRSARVSPIRGDEMKSRRREPDRGRGTSVTSWVLTRGIINIYIWHSSCYLAITTYRRILLGDQIPSDFHYFCSFISVFHIKKNSSCVSCDRTFPTHVHCIIANARFRGDYGFTYVSDDVIWYMCRSASLNSSKIYRNKWWGIHATALDS